MSWEEKVNLFYCGQFESSSDTQKSAAQLFVSYIGGIRGDQTFPVYSITTYCLINSYRNHVFSFVYQSFNSAKARLPPILLAFIRIFGVFHQASKRKLFFLLFIYRYVIIVLYELNLFGYLVSLSNTEQQACVFRLTKLETIAGYLTLQSYFKHGLLDSSLNVQTLLFT